MDRTPDGLTFEAVRDELRSFVDERNWAQFHNPASLSRSISIEAAELLECFQWNDDADRDEVTQELADVLTYCFLLSDHLDVNPLEAVVNKLAVTRGKYPVDKSHSVSTKYDRL